MKSLHRSLTLPEFDALKKEFLLTILIAESILRPDTTSAFFAMHSINKSVAFRNFSLRPIIFGVAEQARWHARPNCENDESEQITDCHRPSTCFIQPRARRPARTTQGLRVAVSALVLDKSIARDSVIVQPDQEGDRTRNMNERIQPVYVHHEEGVGHEKLLDWDFPEDVEMFFDLDELEGMTTRDMHRAFDKGNGSERSTKLVDLLKSAS